MKASIQDRDALMAVSPAALSAYARSVGWTKSETFGGHSDVFVGEGLPEVILPRTEQLGDYANVVSILVGVFANVADMDELAMYRDLVTADRDVIRIRVDNGDTGGSVAVNDGIDLMSGARDMVLAAACSLQSPRAAYRAGANKDAADYIRRVRLGQTEHGSFGVTVLGPVVPPKLQMALSPEFDFEDDPIERKVTKRLAEALVATRDATEQSAAGEESAFNDVIVQGVSANLCEALVKLIGPFSSVDTNLVWARTRPMEIKKRTVQFASHDVPILREAARAFHEREPQIDKTLTGIVQRLQRDEDKFDGTISLSTSIEDRNQAVVVVLQQEDYNKAIQAHKSKFPIVLKGDLERKGQRWQLLNPVIKDVIKFESTPEETS